MLPSLDGTEMQYTVRPIICTHRRVIFFSTTVYHTKHKAREIVYRDIVLELLHNSTAWNALIDDCSVMSICSKGDHRQRRGRSPTIREVQRHDNDTSSLTNASNDGFDQNDSSVLDFDEQSEILDAGCTPSPSPSPSPPSSSSSTTTAAIQTIILLPFLLMLSTLVTILILYMVGYENKLHLLFREIQKNCDSKIPSLSFFDNGFMALQHQSSLPSSYSSSWLVRTITSFMTSARTGWSHFHSSEMDRREEDDRDYNTNYTIYDLKYFMNTSSTGTSDNRNGDVARHDHHELTKDDNTRKYLSQDCRSKAALSLKKNIDNDADTETGMTTKCRSILTKDMLETFHKDGVIAIRGLLSPDLIQNLNQSSLDIMEAQLEKVGFRTATGTFDFF